MHAFRLDDGPHALPRWHGRMIAQFQLARPRFLPNPVNNLAKCKNCRDGVMGNSATYSSARE